jgi:nucleotide-binding universal stress UspA family protein
MRVLRVGFVALMAVSLLSCASTRRRRVVRPVNEGGDTISLGEPLPVEQEQVAAIAAQLVATDLKLAVPIDGDHQASLRARWLQLDQGVPTIAVVVVPGGGAVGLDGKRTGDGSHVYAKPVAVAAEWQQALAMRGAGVLTYDKRTCGPNDEAACTKNPELDIDALGPLAMSKDVDAACAAARGQVAANTPLVLVTHGQGGQVMLASACAEQAAVMVVQAPIPRSIDLVLVDALRAREQQALASAKDTTSPEEKEAWRQSAAQFRNQAASKEAGFVSMAAGKFSPTARVDGATIPFWLGWMEATKTNTAFVAHQRKLLIVVGAVDAQFSPEDRQRQREVPAAKVLYIEGADHHLLTEEVLAQSTIDVVGSAIDQLLAVPRG